MSIISIISIITITVITVITIITITIIITIIIIISVATALGKEPEPCPEPIFAMIASRGQKIARQKSTPRKHIIVDCQWHVPMDV